MSDIAILNPVVAGQQTHKSQSHEGAPSQNVMALAYYYLIEAATNRTESALVKAKETKANAMQQEQLNKEAGELNWNYVPKLDITYKVEHKKESKWTWKFWKGPGFHYYRYKTIRKKDVKNQGTVSAIQTENEQVAAERQTLTQRMSVLQQEASVSMAHINSLSDEAAQVMQEGSAMQQIIQNLTFKALLRQQPR